MLYRITVAVEGEVYVQTPYTVEVPPHTIHVLCNNENKVTHLAVEIRLENYKPYIPRFIYDDSGQHQVVFTINRATDDMLGLLQHIESLGSTLFGIRRIRWDNPQEEWLAETEEEQEELTLTRWARREASYPTQPTDMPPHKLLQLVMERELYKQLVIPISFVREGDNEYTDLRYVSAFYNYYFFLEDLYGGGKTNNRQVEESFKKSPQLAKAIQLTLALYQRDTNRQERLEALLKAEGCMLDVPGVIRLIVQSRGDLHHFSQRSSRKKAHPLNQEQFQPIAYLLMSICRLAVVAIISQNSYGTSFDSLPE